MRRNCLLKRNRSHPLTGKLVYWVFVLILTNLVIFPGSSASLMAEEADHCQILRLADYSGPIEMPEYSPSVKPYKLPLNLNQVERGNTSVINNLLLSFFLGYGHDFSVNEVEALLRSHGFVVVKGTQNRTLVDIYQNSLDLTPKMITSDAILHIYHIIFEHILKKIEENELYNDILILTQAMLEASKAGFGSYCGPLKEAAGKNYAFFSVALRLLEETQAGQLPPEIEAEVEEELTNINGLNPNGESPIFTYSDDYTQYLPRGHYTKSEQLQGYFRTLIWYGRMAFLLKGRDVAGSSSGALVTAQQARIQTLQAALIAEALHRQSVSNRRLLEIWNRIYQVTAFFVGLADDLTPLDYLCALEKIYQNSPLDPVSLAGDENLFLAFKSSLALLPSPRIYGGTGSQGVNIFGPGISAELLDEILDKTRGMRFLGQRFVPDAYILGELVFPSVPGTIQQEAVFTTTIYGFRGLPRGLDLFSVLGSDRAKFILDAFGDADYPGYPQQVTSLRQELASFGEDEWRKNLYWGWLSCLKALIREYGPGYPAFMQTDAWKDKELNTALASWSQLRHDTLLYAKQSNTCIPILPMFKLPEGYVEPVPEFYAKILGLTKITRLGLKGMDLLNDTEESRLTKFENLIDKLLQLSIKELQNVSIQEEDFLFNGTNLFTSFGNILHDLLWGFRPEDRCSIMVADVHTDQGGGKVLQEGVGYWHLLLAVCPVPGDDERLFLAAGPVFSYYEFKQPIKDRLTDGGWKQLLDSADAPATPIWTHSFSIDTEGHDRRSELPYTLKTTSQNRSVAQSNLSSLSFSLWSPWLNYPLYLSTPYSWYFFSYPGSYYFMNQYNSFQKESWPPIWPISYLYPNTTLTTYPWWGKDVFSVSFPFTDELSLQRYRQRHFFH